MSNSDDTPTERKLKPRIQSSDARALQHRHTSAVGIPVPAIEDDPENMTGPFDLFDMALAERRRRPGDSVAELAAKLRRERPDPYDLLAMFAFEHVDATKRDRSANQELDKQFRSFMTQQPGGKEFEDVKRTVKFWKWLGALLLVPTLGALGLAFSALIAQARHEGELNSDITRLKSDMQQLLSDERSSRHHQGPNP